MGTKIPPIQKPNFLGITGMPNRDLIMTREYYIMRIVQARRAKDADTLEAALEWLDALCSEMRLRGEELDQRVRAVI